MIENKSQYRPWLRNHTSFGWVARAFPDLTLDVPDSAFSTPHSCEPAHLLPLLGFHRTSTVSHRHPQVACGQDHMPKESNNGEKKLLGSRELAIRIVAYVRC